MTAQGLLGCEPSWEMEAEEGCEAGSKAVWSLMPSSQVPIHLHQWFANDCVLDLESLQEVGGNLEAQATPQITWSKWPGWGPRYEDLLRLPGDLAIQPGRRP